MYKRLLLWGVACLVSWALQAQVSFTVEGPGVVAVGERFRLVFTANEDFEQFTPPQIQGFYVMAGPTPSSMTSTQIINGKRSHSKTVSYTYILEAEKEGRYTIGAASVRIQGKTYNTEPLTIEVVGKQQPAAGASSQAAEPGQSEAVQASDQDIFLRLSLSKNRVVKGEHLVATLKLYTRVGIAGFEDVKFPSFTGFWSQETYTPQNIEFQRESVGGKIYQSAVLRRYILLPQQTGTLEIDPSEMVCLVQIRDNSRGRSLLDDFFDSYQTVRKRITAPRAKVEVSPLPAGAPANFQGAVGTFSLDVRIARDTVKAHEALSYFVSLKGEGNINMVEAPQVSFPPDFEVYDPKVTDNSKSSGATYAGTKQFEYTLIPRSHGDFTLPAVEFSYFDIKTKSYKTLRSAPLALSVLRNQEAGEYAVSGPVVSRRGVKDLGQDIRHIVTALPRLRTSKAFFVGSPASFALLLALLLLFGAAHFLLRRRGQRRRDVAGLRNRKANKAARTRLKTARLLLQQGLFSAFYEEIHRAMWGYMADKLGLGQAQCAKDSLSALLEGRGVEPALITEFNDLIEGCEFARYAPNPGQGANEKVYERAVACISQMEQKLR